MIVEDGSIVPNANSMCSVAFADAFLAAINSAEWALLLTAAKEAALINATLYLESQYVGKWDGTIVRNDQPLSHPRIGLSIDGRFILSSIVHSNVQQAVSLLALYKATGTELAGNTGRVEKSVKIGVLQFDYEPGQQDKTTFTLVEGLLSPFIKSGGGANSMRVVR
jgi:hypothetical protein